MMKTIVRAVLMLGCQLISQLSYGQNQLVMLKGNSVVARYAVGDNMIYEAKDSEVVINTRLTGLSDTTVFTELGTVPLYNIDKLYFQQYSFRRTVGATLVLGGAAYFLVDQVNYLLTNGRLGLDEQVNRIAVPSVLIGLPLLIFRKKSQRVNQKYKLLSIDRDSFLYRVPPLKTSPSLRPPYH